MTKPDPTNEPLERTERYHVSEPTDIDVAISAGNVSVQLTAAPDEQLSPSENEVTVQLRHDPSARAPWAESMNAMVNLFGGQFAERFGGNRQTNPADAVAETRIEQTDGRLVIQAAAAVPLRDIPLAVIIHAPEGSGLTLKTSTADVTVTGQADRVDVSTGSGDVTLHGTNVSCRARTGSGALRLGTVHENLSARAGSGTIDVATASGSASAVTGTGAVWFGETTGDVFARTGSANIAVADARSGTVELNTGAGDLRIGISTGVTGAVDVSSGTGRVISELDVLTEQPSERTTLSVHAHTGTGNAVLRRSGL